MPWALFSYGRSKPPKTPFRRALWGVAVLLFCGALLPFFVIGAVQQWTAWEMPDAVFSTLFAVAMAAGVGVAVYGLIDIRRARRASRTAPNS